MKISQFSFSQLHEFFKNFLFYFTLCYFSYCWRKLFSSFFLFFLETTTRQKLMNFLFNLKEIWKKIEEEGRRRKRGTEIFHFACTKKRKVFLIFQLFESLHLEENTEKGGGEREIAAIFSEKFFMWKTRARNFPQHSFSSLRANTQTKSFHVVVLVMEIFFWYPKKDFSFLVLLMQYL